MISVSGWGEPAPGPHEAMSPIGALPVVGGKSGFDPLQGPRK